MSHQVQLSPAASHRPTAVLDRPGTSLSHQPAAADARHSPGRTCAGYCPTLEIQSARPSFSPLQMILRRARDRYGRTVPRGPATVHRQADSRKEGSARTPRATCARRLRADPSRQRSASKAHDLDRPASYPAGTCHRPPVDPLRHQAQASPPTTTRAHPVAELSTLRGRMLMRRSENPLYAWLAEVPWRLPAFGCKLGALAVVGAQISASYQRPERGRTSSGQSDAV
jgi:hypothetical protein